MKYDLKELDLTIGEIVNQLSDGDTIYLDDITYYEKIVITKKNITFIGRPNSKISFDAYHGAIVPISMGGDGIKTFGTTGSATFTVLNGADNFHAQNITFENYYKRENRPAGQAVAFKTEANHTILENCKFISEQDTLYIDYGKYNIIKDCEIEGDIDFIFGSADCRFISCKIFAKNIKGNAYFTAPDTYSSNKEGFVFESCEFIALDSVCSFVGRAWFPSGATEEVFPRLTILNSRFYGDVTLDLIQMHKKDPRRYELKIENCFLNDKNIKSFHYNSLNE